MAELSTYLISIINDLGASVPIAFAGSFAEACSFVERTMAGTPTDETDELIEILSIPHISSFSSFDREDAIVVAVAEADGWKMLPE